MQILNPDGLSWKTLEKVELEVAKVFADWKSDGQKRREASLFVRGAFATPKTRAQGLEAARLATTDDIVSTALLTTGALSLQGVGWEGPDNDMAAGWNEVALKSSFNQFLRDALWDLSVFGVFTGVVWRGRHVFTPGGKGPRGERSRRSRVLESMPLRQATLPIERVFRLNRFWGDDQLAWICADRLERDELARAWESGDDLTTMKMFGPPDTEFSPADQEKMRNAGLDPQLALPLMAGVVFQGRMPGHDWGNGALTPMTPLLTHLETKALLSDSDRASLIAAANFIIVVKIGTDARPADQTEVDGFRDGMHLIAKLPYVIGDHRLDISILSPDTSAVLNADKHAVVNHRIAAATLGLPDDMMLPQTAKSDPEVPARMMVAALMSRRQILAETLRERLVFPWAEDQGINLLASPKLAFTPRQIPLVGVTAAMNAALAARARRDLSRRSYLEGIGNDHDTELERVRDEDESGADDVFQTHQPFDSPANTNGGTPPGAQGQTGGRPSGDKTKPGQGKPRTATGGGA